ncbi:unnamed protein product [Schistosoma intercalatum]|nr:unnamed protein product [Schistosoma intercalatum]
MHLTLVQIYISTQISSAYLIIGFEITSLKDTWVMISLNPLHKAKTLLSRNQTISLTTQTQCQENSPHFLSETFCVCLLLPLNLSDIRLKQSA